jgi:hypothetical protein
LWNYQRMPRLVVAVALSLVFCSLIGAADTTPSSQRPPAGQCGGRKDRAGECLKVRGRLRAYAGYPRCRIWPIGTTRLLGVADPSSLPANVACGDGFEVYADFLVCPLTDAKATGLQMVCVASASNIRASEIKPEGSR